MSLTVCLVTRDAEALLDRPLRSVAGLGAQIVVADTGSTDQTVAVARRLGAEAFVVPWQHDFGATQNEALARATGDWILWLNPDEELLSAGTEQLPSLLARPDALAYVLRVQQVMNPDAPERAMETRYPRLFRRLPELRFVGRLHPTFAPSLPELAQRHQMQIYQSELVIRHHGYLSALTPDKLRWATRLLQLELRDRPGQLHYLIEYGRNLLLLNEPRGHQVLAEAADQVRAAAAAPTAPLANVAALLEYLLTVSPAQSQSRLPAEQARELALRWFPKSPPLLWALAQRAFQANDFPEAAGLLERLVQLGRTGTYDHAAPFDPAIMGELALLNLARCHVRVGNLDQAEACFGALLTSPTHQAEARQGYALVQELRRRAPG